MQVGLGVDLEWDVCELHISERRNDFPCVQYNCSSDKPPEVGNDYMQWTKKFQKCK